MGKQVLAGCADPLTWCWFANRFFSCHESGALQAPQAIRQFYMAWLQELVCLHRFDVELETMVIGSIRCIISKLADWVALPLICIQQQCHPSSDITQF